MVSFSAAIKQAGETLFPQFFTVGNDPIEFVIQDIAVIMVVAAIMLAITFKLRQPMVIGYIIAGMIIGPYVPPFSLIHSTETLNLFAELGIIMLLFVAGTLAAVPQEHHPYKRRARQPLLGGVLV